MLKKINFLVFAAVVINLVLNIYGNTWGLPFRWHADESVVNTLHMAGQKTLIDPIGEFLKPTGYNIFLLITFIPAYVFLKIVNYPLGELGQAALVSWNNVAIKFPDFAGGIYLYARVVSAVLGALCVYLIYLLGREMYEEKAGVFSAVFLAISMGFIAVNHFAQYVSLLNLLIILVLLLCVKAQKSDSAADMRKLLFSAFLFSGFAASVHINAPLLLLPLSLTFIYSFNKLANKFSLKVLILFGCGLAYITGILLGTPSLLTNLKDYLSGTAYGGIVSANTIFGSAPIFIGPVNYFFEVLSIFGLPIFCLVCLGLARWIFSPADISRPQITVCSFILSYYFIMTVLNQDKYPQDKYIIAIIPLLAIFAGKFASDLIKARAFPRAAKFLFFSLIITYSIFYSIKADRYFLSGDTRYASTKWVYQNVPSGAKLEVFDQLDYVLSSSLIKEYEIIYLGRSSKKFYGKNFFKWNKVAGREDYMKMISENDSSSDYIIIDLNDVKGFLASDSVSHIAWLNEYVRALFRNQKNYRLVKKFEPQNKKIENNYGLVYFKNMLWDPIPCYRTTANTIYIFKKIGFN
ncbi:MAG: glycosyltransferase family 39 protein [Candidatus Omnitrophota bacterium]|nr:glycosyltransferase family 39 protein [Candidatus Omnitrophota bacterium]